MLHVRSVAIKGAGITAVYMFGGLLVGLGLALLSGRLPMHVPAAARNVLSGFIALSIMLAASARWGRAMAHLSGSHHVKRMAWAGALSFGPAVILAGIALAMLEGVFVGGNGASTLPIHVVFGFLFVPAAFFVGGTTGLAVGVALKDVALAGKLVLGAGLAAALAFLAADVVMDAIGWRVGAPGAAKRATMLTVTMIGSLAAALAGGATIGAVLAARLNDDQGTARAGKASAQV